MESPSGVKLENREQRRANVKVTKRVYRPAALVLAVLHFAAAWLPAAPLAAQECSRACLHDHMERYLSALVAGDPALVDLSRARVTENGVEVLPGEGLWETVTGLGDYRIDVADPETGQVAIIGEMLENDASTLFAVRLRVAADSIVEVEAIAGRASIPGTLVKMAPRASLLDIEPQRERLDRAAMLATARANFVGHLGGDAVFADDCERVENRKQMTGNPELGNIGCDFTFDTLDSVEPQRFLIVDEERQLVFGVFMLNWYAGAACTDNPGRERPCPPPTGLLSAEVLDVSGGMIHHAEVVCAYTGYAASTGWD